MVSFFLESHADSVSLQSSYDAILWTMGYPSDVPSPLSLPSITNSYSESSNTGLSLDGYKEQVLNYDSALLNYYTDVVVPSVALHNAQNADLLLSLNDRNRDNFYYEGDRYANETQDFIDNANTQSLIIKNYVLGGGLRASYHSYVDNGKVWYQTDITGFLFSVETLLYKRVWQSCCLASEPCSIGN